MIPSTIIWSSAPSVVLPFRDRVRLQHILDAAIRARRLVAGRNRRDLFGEEQLSLALQRLIGILSYAATAVSPAARAQAPDIPWEAIAGMRDRIIHAYFDVDLNTLWDTVTDDLPPLIAQLEALIDGDDLLPQLHSPD